MVRRRPKNGETIWLQQLEDPLVFFDRARKAEHDATSPGPLPLVEYRLKRLAGNVAFYEMSADPVTRP